MLAGGEAGREVVSGEAHLVSLIGEVVSNQNRELYGYIGQLSRAIAAMEPVVNVMVGNKEFDSYIVEKSMDGISRMNRMAMAGRGI